MRLIKLFVLYKRKGMPRDLFSSCDVVSYINDEATQHAQEIKTYNTGRS